MQLQELCGFRNNARAKMVLDKKEAEKLSGHQSGTKRKLGDKKRQIAKEEAEKVQCKGKIESL